MNRIYLLSYELVMRRAMHGPLDEFARAYYHLARMARMYGYRALHD